MSKTTSANFEAAKNAQTGSMAHLVLIYNYDGSTDLQYTDWDADITFDGLTYTAFPMVVSNLEENSDGSSSRASVTVGNADRVIQALIEANDFRGLKVEIRTVWLDKLADTAAVLLDTFYINTLQAEDESVNFELTSRLDLLDVVLPGRRLDRQYCQWEFKGTICAYAGSEAACDHTLGRCRALDNVTRFGGFPGLPMEITYGIR